MFSPRTSSFLLALAAGLVVGVGYPFIDLALACRIPTSEACVWGKAYLPLTLAVSVVLLGGTAAGLIYLALRWLRRPKSRGDGA
jgi:hypothetical protein